MRYIGIVPLLARSEGQWHFRALSPAGTNAKPTVLGLEGPPPAAERHHFRADLEGLRAVAVVLVLLYHAGVPWFPGGYVGVDVFFVLSGFLITGLLLREVRETGTVSLAAFYARRVRRLLPAALLVLVVTLVASVIVLSPLRRPDLAGDAIAAALYFSNVRFALQATDYLQADLAPSPLLHYWTLGVEEQFYLLWPALVLLVVGGVAGAAAVRRVGIAVVVIGVASFAAALVLISIAEPWAFLSLPTRAWELALGAVIAVAAAHGTGAGLAARSGSLGRLAASPATGTALVCMGIAMIVAAGVFLDARTPFPGVAALLPTAGAALVIAAGMRGRPPGLPSRALALPPLRWLGRISYSVYLWHWPLLLLPLAAVGGALPLAARLGLVLLSIPIAALTTRLVEEPIRRGGRIRLRPGRTLALAGAGMAVAVAVSVGVGTLAPVNPSRAIAAGPGYVDDAVLDRSVQAVLGPPRRTTASEGPAPMRPPTPPTPLPAGLRPSLIEASRDIATTYASGCHGDIPQLAPPPCVYGDAGSGTTVVLFGDSFAVQWFPGLVRLATIHHWRLLPLTKSACPAVDQPVWAFFYKRAYGECDTYLSNTLARIASERPALVIVSSSHDDWLAVDGQGVSAHDRPELWSAAQAGMLGKLSAVAGNVVLLEAAPRPMGDPTICLSTHVDDTLACDLSVEQAMRDVALPGERSAAEAAGATVIDMAPWVCPSDPCPTVIGDALVYRDTRHISATFASVLAPYLFAELPTLEP